LESILSYSYFKVVFLESFINKKNFLNYNMNNTMGLEECIIKGVLETKEDARDIGFDLVRLGRRINEDNIVNEIIYRKENKPKDKENLPAYRNNEILINNEKRKTLELFIEQYGKEKKRCFQNINRILIPCIFGDGFIRLFNYSQRKLNQTKKQRIGGEKLKDAYIFVHTFRTVEILQEFEATDYQKRLGFLHDIIEELRDWRIKKVKDNLVRDIDEERKLREEIKSAPEYKEIYDLLVKRRKGNWKEIISEEEAKSTKYHLRLLTRRVNESYKNYVKRMHHGCFKDKIKKKVKYLTFDKKEQINFYAAPLVVKIADSIDNTRRLREGNISDRISRLYHNLYTLKEVDNFLYRSKFDMIIRLRKGLIESSKEEVERNIRDFENDNDPAVKSKFKIFQELKDRYNDLDKRSTYNPIIQKDKNIEMLINKGYPK